LEPEGQVGQWMQEEKQVEIGGSWGGEEKQEERQVGG
jgi:hypothetical protein